MLRTEGLRPTQVQHSSEVLLLVDVINPFQFPRAKTLIRDASKAAQHIVSLKARLQRKGFATIYANDNYGTWHSEFSQIFAACCDLPGERGAIARLLSPSANDLVILKPQHSAFHSTPLLHLLRRMEATRLVIAGFATDMCVFLTATDARMAGYEVWVPRDCTAAETPERKESALKQLKHVFKCSTGSAKR